MSLLETESQQIICKCGNDKFATFGDSLGFTDLVCIQCNYKINIVESLRFVEKLLSAEGDDFCFVYGNYIDDKIIVDKIIFTENKTELEILNELNYRLEHVKSEKNKAVNNEWFERASKNRQEEQKTLKQINFHIYNVYENNK